MISQHVGSKGEYTIIDFIGKGTFGEVYKAINNATN